MTDSVAIHKHPLKINQGTPQGDLVTIGGETYYKITNSDLMRPFFMSVVSDSNHWMFIGSNGGLTAGRKNNEYALFPYYTDEKIIESQDITGSKTIMRVKDKDGVVALWEPFSEQYKGLYNTSRNLYKNIHGNKIIFEEINRDLGLTFRYHWNSSNQYGFVRRSELENGGDQQTTVEVLDGIQNILPHGVNPDVQGIRSNLVDAYKKNEIEQAEGLGIYALSAIIVDRAEPSEALKANVAWSIGLNNPKYLCSSIQLDSFRFTGELTPELEVKGEKGAYFVNAEFALEPGANEHWFIVANVNQGPANITMLLNELKQPQLLREKIEEDIERGTMRLVALVASADGLQQSQDRLRTARHFSNVLYNIMRGGIIDNNYILDKADFIPYIVHANTAVFDRHKVKLEGLPDQFNISTLKDWAESENDPDLIRLCIEYLPLKFSRRHGDPSRPWNRFSINTQSEKDGSKILDYEGNWRDIFQNWEALAHSFPEYIDGMIHKFLNASTFDGYNPYRVTKGGFDWEIIEPDDPWSYIGYWGDHQIIYLLKFLEIIENYYPSRLAEYWRNNIFVYANVPYVIKPYADIVKDPKDTIEFDDVLHDKIEARRSEIGADGALLRDDGGSTIHVNLAEKLLATLLAKCSNFVPEAGIWLNTQRPEWNDANNALVGNGVSMVTLYYLRRFLSFLEQFIDKLKDGEVEVSEELGTLFGEIMGTLEKFENKLIGQFNDSDRKSVVDALGEAGGIFRGRIYNQGFSGKRIKLTKEELQSFCKLMGRYAEHTIEANKRDDDLYHAYNLIEFTTDGIEISYLSEMLEGQVAVLSSGHLSAKESLSLLDSLRSSALYREDQDSYILYPDKNLPRFVDKNIIPEKQVNSSKLLKLLVQEGNGDIIIQDVKGKFHFNGSFNNAAVLDKALDELTDSYKDLIEQERGLILDIYESVFDHKSFTGRSGTFFGYEGLGSIYWHMVSKLSLAVQETCLRAIDDSSDKEVVNRLVQHYHGINEGIGVHKSPGLYGAFPIDPYSHTPAHRGAQQPGMTGQVKEDILCRIGELGLSVKDGKVSFGYGMIKSEEFLEKESEFQYIDLNSEKQSLNLPSNSFAFTFCQVPIVCELTDEESLQVTMTDGSAKAFDTMELDETISTSLFRRNGEIKFIKVRLDRTKF